MNAWANWNTASECYKRVSDGMTYAPSAYSYPYSMNNYYHGEMGRDSFSAFTPLAKEDFTPGAGTPLRLKMRLEWEPSRFIRWMIQRPTDYGAWSLMFQI